MIGISCRGFGVLLDGARARGIPLEALIDGLDVTAEQLANPKGRIPWDDAVVMANRMQEAVGGPEGLRRLGAENFTTESFNLFHVVGRALSRPSDVYYMGTHWVGPNLFPMIHGELWEKADGKLVERLTLQEGHRDCPALFHMLHGALETAPERYGHGKCDIDMQLEPGRATYTIHLERKGHSWLGRMIRAIRAPFTLPTMMNELIQQSVAIEANYTEIRNAHDRIESQATDLERVNSIGRRLAQQIDLDRVADVLVRVMLEELGVRGVELWLIRPERDATGPEISREATAEPRLFRRGGRQQGAPTVHYLLETAARPVGTLKVWVDDEAADTADGQLLSRLLPWIAMSVDNARSYEAMESHAADLEQRVRERTARLLAANHHLVKEIGERKKATEALMQSETQLREAERLASIGTLAAGIAHEINNPIGSILAAAQLALVVQQAHGARTDEEVEAALVDIVSQAKRCGGIVRSVLQFSRDERTEKWDCRIDDIVMRSIRLAAEFAGKRGAELHVEAPAEPVWATLNPIQVEQAIVNLLRNAVESGAREVVVRARTESSPPRVRIEVQDDGPGIGELERGRIFEPFYTTRRSDGGTGLGLSVVHGIAIEHGGELEVEPSADGGTLAALTLPRLPQPVAKDVDPAPPAPAQDPLL